MSKTETTPIGICLFAKPPRAGEVKTRLAESIGEQRAAELARAFIADTWALLETLSWANPVLSTTDPAAAEWGFIPRERVWAQGEGDLGARIERALRRALRLAPAAIALGADTPGLPATLLEQAGAALEECDAVIGPCEDGGFYLLGLRRCPVGMLDGLPWSQRDTFARTLERLRERGLSTKILPTWFDIDRPDDLCLLKRLLETGDIVAPITLNWFKNVGRASPSNSEVTDHVRSDIGI